MSLKKLMNKIFYPKPEKVLGIDIDVDQIKIVQLDMKRNSTPEVTDYVLMDLPENLRNNGFLEYPEELETFLGEIINKHGFSAKDCAFSLGGRSAFVRGITMPPMSTEEMRQAVLWDSAQYVPYEADTYYVDHATYGSLDGEGQQPIVIVAAPKNIVDTLIATADKLALKVFKVDINVLALDRLMGGDVADFIMLDLDRNYSLMTIFQKGAPVAQRSIPGGAMSFAQIIADKLNMSISNAMDVMRGEQLLASEAPENQVVRAGLQVEVDNIVKECRRTAEYFILNKKDAAFSSLILCGPGAMLPGLEGSMNEQMDIKVKLFQVLEKIHFDSRFEKKKVEQNAPSLAVAIGVALAGGEVHD